MLALEETSFELYKASVISNQKTSSFISKVPYKEIWIGSFMKYCPLSIEQNVLITFM